ncbi:MAG TPA: RNA polymerase sigma factor [Patescibacteria group bacterium]
MPSEIELILSGDKYAVVQFYKKYSPKILKYLSAKLPRHEDAQEIMQDTFLEALDELARFQGKSSLSTWLYTIAHNKLVDFYRRQKVRSLLLSQLPFLQIVAQEISEPEFQYEKNKIRDNIESTLHLLSAKYRRILKMHYVENMPIKEIAIELNLSFKATESLLYRARQDFKQKYAGE